MGFWNNIFGNKPSVAIIGCGWIGKPLAEKLIELGYSVNGSTTRVEKKEELEKLGLENVFVGKFTPQWQGDDLSAVLDVDVLVIDFPPGKDSDENYHVLQMQELTKYLKEKTKVIYTSSTSIYPELGKTVYEDDLKTIDNTAHRKIAKAEFYLRNTLKEKLTILRCGGLTGWDRNLAKYFAGKSNLEGTNIPVNLVHGQDVVKAIVAVIAQNAFGEVFNVVAPMHPDKKSFYTNLCEKSGLPAPSFSDIVQDPKFKIVNSDKIQKQLSFTFDFPDPEFFTYNS